MIARRTLLALLAGALTAPAAPALSAQSAFEFDFTAIDGTPMPFSQYRGRPMLVVNTASFCGFTQQYGGLQDVWERYRAQGLVVVGVPSNDFGNQEPGSEAQIKKFCEVNFDIDFPMTKKVSVKGAAAHPFYRWARTELGASAAPRWNFHKYLIDRDGRLVAGFGSSVRPTSRQMRRAIESVLAGTS